MRSLYNEDFTHFLYTSGVFQPAAACLTWSCNILTPYHKGCGGKPDLPHANYGQVVCRRCGSSLLFTNEQHTAVAVAAVAAAAVDLD